MLAGFRVPEKRAAIVARGSKQSTVRTEVDRLDRSSVTRERAQFLLRGNVPDLDRVVAAGGSEQLVVATERDFSNTAAMSFERGDRLAGCGIPKLNLAHCFDLQIAHHVRVIRLF